MSFAVSDLRDRPEFAGAVADRVWRAWWKDKGFPLRYIEQLVAENLGGTSIPFAVVAYRCDLFLGTASVIACDMAERPDHTPWVAAVWVDPQHRDKGVGKAVVRHATAMAWDRGFNTIYLCALPEKSGFYEKQGWRVLEKDVGKDKLCVLSFSAGSIAGQRLSPANR